MSKKVLLIGWDAADWKIIGPLMDSGKMPHLERLARQGVVGNLSTLYPVLSPMLWTSIATGKRAHKHGIHGFSEPDPQSGGVRPITNLGRKTKAIWNILQQNGLKSNMVGWWPSHPAEPISGVMVSNHYQQMVAPLGKPWPVRVGTIHPQHFVERLAELRVHPAELDAEMLLPFIPRAAEIDQKKDFRLAGVAKILAETASIHAAATALMQLEPWDFMGIYFDGIDHFCHGFMKYHPPKLEWIRDDDYDLYNNVVNAGYQFHDMMLGAYMQLADEETTIIIVSDHGFHPDHLRPKELPNEPAGPADEHREFGVVAMMGPDLKQDEHMFGASLLDITPTILTLFGLPVGEDMDGKALLGAFVTPPQIQTVPSWDQIPGDAGLHPAGAQCDPVNQHEALQQLVDLGYIEKPDENIETAAANTVRELRYNLARDYMDANHIVESIAILDELWDTYPDESRFGVHLFSCYLRLGQTESAEEALERLTREKKRCSEQATLALKDLEIAWKDRKPDEIKPEELRKLNGLKRRAGINTHAFAFMHGRLLAAKGRHHDALESYERAKEVQIHNRPSLYQQIGDSLLALGRLEDAEQQFNQIRAIDPINTSAWLGLARVAKSRGKPEQTLDYATSAASLVHHIPQAHYLCAWSLAKLGRSSEAIRSLEIALSQNPVYPSAHNLMASLQKRLQRLDRAAEHRLLAKASLARIRAFRRGEPLPQDTDLDKDLDQLLLQTATIASLTDLEPQPPLEPGAVVVVSGLPRSGTSMMMQMLAAGGLSILSDGKRQADDSNIRGYLEFEEVKKLGRVPGQLWIDQADGRAVKIVAPLLPYLPPGKLYRIIFMERPLNEILASQTAMLLKSGQKRTHRSDRQTAAAFLSQVENVKSILQSHQATVKVLSINYHAAVAAPAEASRMVNRFLGGHLDESAMAASIAPELWRQRAG